MYNVIVLLYVYRNCHYVSPSCSGTSYVAPIVLMLKGSAVANVSYPINAMYGMNCSKWCFAVYVSNSNDRAELFNLI